MPRLLEQPTDAVALSAGTVDALVARGSGDAALLYLYLLRHSGYFDRAEALKATGWEALRLDSALLHLQELNLVGPEKPGQPQPGRENPNAISQEDAPEYTAADITEALEQPEAEYAQLLHLVEGSLGRKLNIRDLKILYELLDYVALPAEVVLTLLQWQIAEAERKHGPGARPSMTTLRSKAYYWKRAGVETQEAADAFLKKQELQSSQMGELMAACGIRGREPTDGEKRVMEQWIARAYPVDLVAYAYDVNLSSTGRFSWQYCSKVLENWWSRQITTVEQARAEKSLPRRRGAKKPAVAPAPAPVEAPPPIPEDAERQAQESARRAAWLQKLIAEGTNPSGSN